jgi:hypothetical protein
MRAALAGLDEGTFTEGHELDRKTKKQIPKAMIGRRLSQQEAKRLLAKFDWGNARPCGSGGDTTIARLKKSIYCLGSAAALAPESSVLLLDYLSPEQLL